LGRRARSGAALGNPPLKAPSGKPPKAPRGTGGGTG